MNVERLLKEGAEVKKIKLIQRELNVIGAIIGYFIGRLCTNNSNQHRGFIS